MGARPNFMKIAPILRAIEKFNTDPQTEHHRLDPCLVHTGQHYDFEMSRIFFKDLDLPEPDVHLGIGSGMHGEQTGRVMIEFEKVLVAEKPDLVIVVGDVNSTLACTLASVKLNIPVAHVEAGLRSFDRTMPEEINRVVTDVLSTYLFTPSPDADENLKREGIQEERIFRVGNVMVDSLIASKQKALKSSILNNLGLAENGHASAHSLGNRSYALLTLHRPSNVDDQESFLKILKALQVISKEVPILFPMHPRSKKQLETFGLRHCFQPLYPPLKVGNAGIYSLAPLGYLHFLRLMMSATFVVTDSGGIQEEATALGVPCLTIRSITERPITVNEGSNTLVGNNTERIIEEASNILNGRGKKGVIPDLWDGKTAERIMSILGEMAIK